MKLIDLLSGVLVGDECWPVGAEGVVQDDDGCLWFFNGGTPEWHERIWIPESESSTFRWVDWDYSAPKSTDNSISIVTREQYESALAAKNDGWINWGGGERPVKAGEVVDVKYRNGNVSCGVIAGPFQRKYCLAEDWNHGGESYDIIAYRLHKSEVKVAEWNGGGLPPIGVEVEFYKNPDYGYSDMGFMPDSGMIVDVVAHKTTSDGNLVAIVYWDDNGAGRSNCFIGACLRPLQTEAERKREVIESWFVSIMPESEIAGIAAKYLYEAIAAGKIPGVKLDD